MRTAATVSVTILQRRNAVAILFGEVYIYAALMKPVVKANAVLRTRPAVILVSQVEHVITLPLKSVVLESLEAMILYAISTKNAVMTARVPRRAKRWVVKRSAAQKIINLAQHVLVSVAVVLVPRQGIIQMKQYTIVVEAALAIVITKIPRQLAMIRISALTIFIINLQSARFGVMSREIYLKIRNLWSVIAEIMFGGALAVSRVALTATGL